MTTATQRIDADQARVFAALADPTTYPEWLVGAKVIRSIDPTWPSPGSTFHHRVGIAGPLTLADSSSVIAIRAPHELVLEVRARPAGRARVEFHLRPAPDGSTEVEFREVPIGLTRILAPVVAPLTLGRNHRSLNRLGAYLRGGG